MHGFRKLFLTVWLFIMIGLVPGTGAALFLGDIITITVSGTVTGPNGPVPDVWIGVGSRQEWRETTTNVSGFYSVNIRTAGQLWLHVRPPESSRLTQTNLYRENVTASFTQNFTITHGYLLSLRPTGRDGAPITDDVGLGTEPLISRQLTGPWFIVFWWDAVNQRFQAVLPPDIYYVTTWRVPAGYYQTTRAFDLRTADQVADMPLNTSYVHPIPYDPPDVSRITVSPPDDLGEATVTGASGAVLPLARVFLVNLNSTHQAHAISEADGSFTARIFAPPGSALMVKHGPASWRWNDLAVGVSEGVNPFPGTIINLPHMHTGGQYALPFAAVGAIDYLADDPNTTRNYVGSAWAMTGTVGPVIVEGDWTRVLTGTYDGEPVPGLYLGGLNWTHPALADLDGDGDLDLLVGEREGRLVLYRNLGSPTSPRWQFEQFGYAGLYTGWWAAPVLTDVTGDRSPDLFIGTGDGRVLIYYNQGTPTVPAWATTPDLILNTGNNAAPALADLDNDGDLDLLVGHQGGTLYFFRNTGTRSSPAWSLVTQSYDGVSEPDVGFLLPSFVDLDSDGDLDLLIGRCDLVWYRNNGPPTNPTWTRMAEGYGGMGDSCDISQALGDWDGYGDFDLVYGHHLGPLMFYRNDGPPNWTQQSIAFPFDLLADSAPALADWDNDGDLDLLIGQVHGNVHRYTNVGSAANPNWRPDGVLLTLPWTNHPHPFPTFADIDGDGDYDLFVGEGSWEGPEAGGNIRFYRNNGTPTSPNWTLVTTSFLGLDVGGWSTPTFVDIDADGDLDLFIGDAAGTLTFVQNTGTRTSPTWAAPVRPYAGLDLGGYSAPAFLDMDGDGDLDLLSGRQDGALAYVRNDGTPTTPAWKLVTTQYPGIHTGERSTPVAADLDGDGRKDLLLGDGDGGLNFYHYLGPGSPPSGPLALAPGDLFQVEGVLRMYSLAITPATRISGITAGGWLGLMMLFDAQGRPLPGQNYFMSTLLTPSGFPIQRQERPIEWLNTRLDVANLRRAGDHAIEGDVVVTGRLPDNLPPGLYRPILSLGFSGVPTSTQWLAANVVHYTYKANEAVLPPILVLSRVEGTVGTVAPPRVIWRLLMDNFVQGTRGTGAREDSGYFELASQIVSQGAPFVVPPVDVRTSQPITYRLEPFLPMISFTDRRMPTPPLLPFTLPGGRLSVQIQQPDGTVRDLGSAPFTQSFHRTKTTRGGNDLNPGTVQLDDVYSLTTADERFRVTFSQYGHHVFTMTGTISDIWGNTYTGGGTYDLWVAHPLDIDPGVLAGTPFQVGDAFNSAMQLHPGVPAEVRLTLTLYPNSDPAQAISQTLIGRANDYGYFGPSSQVLRFAQPGEYRLDLTAIYTDTNGLVYMGAMTWGGVVETPGTPLVAHGRRGVDSLLHIPEQSWYISCRDLAIPPGSVSHTFNAYFNGDILWTRSFDGGRDCGGDALIMAGTVQDTVGVIEAAIRARAERYPPPAGPGTLDERFAAAEIPLFVSTRSGSPAVMMPEDIDQMAYSYQSSQRPGVRVRELVADDNHTVSYWRLSTLYDDQLGVGVQGDLPNDFKFQYVGTVYRDLDASINQYAIQGSLWIKIPDDDPTGSRVMPPFAGPGNGGWTTEGGPILRLKEQDVHMFILPTGTMPGAVLEVGDTFRFAGHIAPTLNSKVAFTVTSPSGVQHLGGGQANKIGYFYDPTDDFTVDEPGLWSVDVRIWHDGVCSGGQTVPPYPSGDLLGSENGRYWFYVVQAGTPRLNVSSPASSFLSFRDQVTPITITGQVPAGLTNTVVDYTITMPGYILKRGQAAASRGTYTVVFDPVALSTDFPNLDLIGRDEWRPGLADTFVISLLLRGQDTGGNLVYRANTITLQGDQVFVGSVTEGALFKVFLPVILKR